MAKVCQTPAMKCIAIPNTGKDVCQIHIEHPDYVASPAKKTRIVK